MDDRPRDRRRASAPFGNPAWVMLSGADLSLEVDRSGRRVEPEFFALLQRSRRARIRLIVKTAALVAIIVLFVVQPSPGIMIAGVVLALVSFFDLLQLVDLRRRIAEAWEDLALGSP